MLLSLHQFQIVNHCQGLQTQMPTQVKQVKRKEVQEGKGHYHDHASCSRWMTMSKSNGQ